jgi:hypothetical protein
MRRLAGYIGRHHVALLALFVALGGTAVAATTKLARNTVGSAQVVNGSLQKVDLSAKAQRALRGRRGATGAAGAAGAAGTARAYAHVRADGTFDAENAKGVTGVVRGSFCFPDCDQPIAGVFCVALGFTPRNAVVTLEYYGTADNSWAVVVLNKTRVDYGFGAVACPDTASVMVIERNQSGTTNAPVDRGFYIAIN